MGMRPQQRSSLGTVRLDRAQCMRMSARVASMWVYNDSSTVMLTCKLLFAAAKAIELTSGLICPGSHKLYLLDFFFVQDQRGGHRPPPCIRL